MKLKLPAEVEVEFSAGTDVNDAVREAVKHSTETGQKVRFKFNSVEFLVSKATIRVDAVNEFYRRLKPITGE